jgi:signal peptidase II
MNNLSKRQKLLYNIAGPVVIAMFFVVDRLLKNNALNLGPGQFRALIGDVLSFRLVFNQNIAFSLPLSGPWLNILISLIVFCLFLIIIHSKIKRALDQKSLFLLTFILFGAISNLIDRFLYGAVVDYFDLKYFTIFNLADVMISVGVFAFFILILKKDRRKKTQ